MEATGEIEGPAIGSSGMVSPHGRYVFSPEGRLALVADASRLLIEAELSPDELMLSLCRSCAASICDFAVIFIVTDDDTFRLAAQADADLERMAERDVLLRDWRGRVGEGITGRVAAEGETLFVPVVDQDLAVRQVPAEHRQHVLDVPTYSYVIAPIRARGRTLGTLTVGRTVAGLPFTAADVGLIEELALRTAFMMATAEQHRALQYEVEQRRQAQTALSESESRYRVLAELSPLAILVNQDSRWAYVNPAAMAMLGARDASELLGRNPPDFFLPQYHAAAMERVSKLMAGQGPNPPLEQQWFRLDGSVFDCEVVSAAITWEGRPAILLECQEITERKLAQEAQKAASIMKDEFLGLVSHELRTPLTSIYGFARLLTRNPGLPAETVREGMTQILTESERLGRIVENMLVLARLQAGQVLPVEPVLLAKAVTDARDTFARTAEGGPVSLELQADGVVVMAVPEYLDQVLQNLLSNARKYSPAGEDIDIVVRLADSWTVIDVADRGQGVEDAEAIFSPFVREAGAETRAPGLGLGLTVCRTLVEAMGGNIRAASRDGGGTVFSVALPAISASA